MGLCPMGTRESQSSRVRRAMRPRGLVKTVNISVGRWTFHEKQHVTMLKLFNVFSGGPHGGRGEAGRGRRLQRAQLQHPLPAKLPVQRVREFPGRQRRLLSVHLWARLPGGVLSNFDIDNQNLIE